MPFGLRNLKIAKMADFPSSIPLVCRKSSTLLGLRISNDYKGAVPLWAKPHRFGRSTQKILGSLRASGRVTRESLE